MLGTRIFITTPPCRGVEGDSETELQRGAGIDMARTEHGETMGHRQVRGGDSDGGESRRWWKTCFDNFQGSVQKRAVYNIIFVIISDRGVTELTVS